MRENWCYRIAAATAVMAIFTALAAKTGYKPDAGADPSISLALVEQAFGRSRNATSHLKVARISTTTIYFDTSYYSGARAADLSRWGRQALSQWNALSADATFVESARRWNADVVIEFTERVDSPNGIVAGFAQWTRGTSGNVDGYIRISNRTLGGGQMSASQIRKTISHELGHILGLDDESDSSRTMGPISISEVNPGKRDQVQIFRNSAPAQEIYRAPLSDSGSAKVFTFAKRR